MVAMNFPSSQKKREKKRKGKKKIISPLFMTFTLRIPTNGLAVCILPKVTEDIHG